MRKKPKVVKRSRRRITRQREPVLLRLRLTPSGFGPSVETWFPEWGKIEIKTFLKKCYFVFLVDFYVFSLFSTS